MEDRPGHRELTTLRAAGAEDVAGVAALVNAAFRVEAFFVDGERTSPEEVRGSLQKGTWLLAEEQGRLLGCVFVQAEGASGYFGMLAVDPGSQGRGLGRLLVGAAEERCHHCSTIHLLIVNLRTELLGFYRKLGYEEKGTSPFPGRSRLPCHFVRMEKALS